MGNQAKSNSLSALLVIDIQQDFIGEHVNSRYKNAPKFINTVNQVITTALNKGYLVIYIKHEFEGILGKLFANTFFGGKAIKGNPGTEFDGRLQIKSTHCFSKQAPDSFSNSQLQRFLKDQQVSELYLVGLDAEYCVYATAKGGLKHGYPVTIIQDAIALQAEPKWEQLLEKYLRDGITLSSSREF